jgi:diguanylate cyclase (GGDEF)-like protein/PAS domain S-box-containing protein
MQLQVHPFSIPFLVATAVSIRFATMIWPRRKAPGAMPLFVHVIGLGVWSGASAAMWLSTTLNAQLFWLEFSSLGVLITPLTFLLFSLQASHHDQLLKRRWLFLLAIEPMIGLILLWTNDYHHFVYGSVELWLLQGLREIHWVPGAWYVIDTVYMYVIILVGVWFLANSIRHNGELHRHQIKFILAGACLPLLADLVYLSPLSDHLRNLDLAPIVFTVSSGFYLFAIERRRFLDLVPVAHTTLINSMTDGVVVLDDHDRILEMNPAAGEFLGVIPGRVAGHRAKEILYAWRETTQPFLGKSDLRTEIRVTGDNPRILDLKVTPLVDRRKRARGRMLVFRDITLQKQNEAMLKASNEKLKEQLDEIRALRDQLREQATRDPLTNLYNRRYLEEMLQQELARASREHYPVCVIMMDIDRFKLVNDTCGHKAGDEVLRSLATLIVLHIRRFDAACRFGGEEFVIVLPKSSVETARARAEFLRREFSNMPLPCERMKSPPTLSIGLAAYPFDGIDSEQLLDAADQALYAAKGSGRNRTVMYSDLADKKKTSEGKTPK